jgi:HK97 family phage major capsid protein
MSSIQKTTKPISKRRNMKDLIKQAKALAETAAAEGRTLTDEERATVETAIAGAKAVKADAELRKAVDELGNELAEVKPVVTETAKARTTGEKLFADPSFKTWIDSANRNGTPDIKSLPNSPTVAVSGLKATLLGGSDTSAGAMVQNDMYRPAAQAFGRDITAINLVTVGSTTSDLVEFARAMRITGGQSVNAAVPKAEGIAADESTLTFVKDSAAVKDIRHFLPASVRALSDAQQLETLANTFLTYGIQEEIEDQLVNGNGQGENWTGIFNTGYVQAQAWDTDLVTSIRKAIRKVQTVGNSRATAVLLHPEDNERIDLLSGDSTDYLFGGPATQSTPTIWGLPRVVSQAVPVGNAIVGDFRKAIIWERSPLTVAVYPQHSDYAIKGLVALVANARAAFGVLHPEAFCTVDLTA